MLNLIKMNVCRMFKNRSTYVLLILTALFSFITIYSMYAEQEYYRENPDAYELEQQYLQEIEESDEDSITVGFTTGAASIKEYTLLEIVDGWLPGMLPCLLLAIFTVIFVCSEHNSGFVKNISGQVSNRGKLYLAKLPAILIFNILLIGVTILAMLIPFRPLLGYFHLGDGSDFVKLMALQFVAYSVFAVVVSAIAAVLRSTAVSMTFGVVMTSGMIGIVYMLVTAALKYLFDGVPKSFNLSDYTVSGTVPQLSAGVTDSIMKRGLIVLGVYLVVSIVVTYFVNKKRDV